MNESKTIKKNRTKLIAILCLAANLIMLLQFGIIALANQELEIGEIEELEPMMASPPKPCAYSTGTGISGSLNERKDYTQTTTFTDKSELVCLYDFDKNILLASAVRCSMGVENCHGGHCHQ